MCEKLRRKGFSELHDETTFIKPAYESPLVNHGGYARDSLGVPLMGQNRGVRPMASGQKSKMKETDGDGRQNKNSERRSANKSDIAGFTKNRSAVSNTNVLYNKGSQHRMPDFEQLGC